MKLLERFRTEQQSDLEVLGTVKEIVGKGGKIYYSNSNNVMNPNKQLQITLDPKVGASQTLLCSKALTRQLRSGDLSLNDVMFCSVVVTKFTTEDGVDVEDVRIAPQQGESLEGQAVSADSAKETPKAKKIDFLNKEGYIAF
jgi:hypothetical protein